MKLINFEPNFHFENLYKVDYKLLKENKIKNLLIDLDNTIVKPDSKEFTKKELNHLKKLQKDFLIIIFSNSPNKRVGNFIKNNKINYNSNSLKPTHIGFNKVFKEYNLKKEETAIMGDQLLTDVLGGNTYNITTILLKPLVKKDFILTKPNRFIENIILQKLEKKGTFKRSNNE